MDVHPLEQHQGPKRDEQFDQQHQGEGRIGTGAKGEGEGLTEIEQPTAEHLAEGPGKGLGQTPHPDERPRCLRQGEIEHQAEGTVGANPRRQAEQQHHQLEQGNAAGEAGKQQKQQGTGDQLTAQACRGQLSQPGNDPETGHSSPTRVPIPQKALSWAVAAIGMPNTWAP